MSSDAPPSKRKRPQRTCVALALKKKQLADKVYVYERLEEVHAILATSPHTHNENVVRALLHSISTYLESHRSDPAHASTTACMTPASNNSEHKDQADDLDDGINIDDEDSWSDELSEHSSDIDFIAASDDEGSYVPSEEEEEYVDSTNSDE